MAEKATLQYAPFTSSIDTGFWHSLSKKKLDELKLDEAPVSITGFFCNNNANGIPCLLQVDYSSFVETPNDTVSTNAFRANGTLTITNTIEKFKEMDKKLMLQECGEIVWNRILDESSLSAPADLNAFILLTHANLKKYHFYYWFAFPALTPNLPVQRIGPVQVLSNIFTESQVSAVLRLYEEELARGALQYFVLHSFGAALALYRLDDPALHFLPLNELVFAFSDPSTNPGYPGWPLRNYLASISAQFVKRADSEVRILGFRDRSVSGQRRIEHSVHLTVILSPINSQTEPWHTVGWEKDKQNKMLPRFVNMAKSMDPIKLAESAVDLNLKLMKWRLLPDLDLDVISQTKCLLLGAGTLGCNVARNLMGWGVRHITLVDNAIVSYSNPVRQSLFTFQDSLASKPKAETAAQHLKAIFPGEVAEGLSLTIPMPGHPVSESSMQTTLDSVAKLEELVKSHDAIFLLMDSRESRWLPTLLGSTFEKLVLTAAMGFDTWVAMRHGCHTDSQDSSAASSLCSEPVPGDMLGCYFCNDVVAPRDSSKDRALDQQCTVSRPGLSMLCSALIVELMVSVLQHPDRMTAAASTVDDEDDEKEQCILGLIPHQLRGSLARYQIYHSVTRKFSQCSACSRAVVEAYREGGVEFLLKAFNDPLYLEEITGLDKVHGDPLCDEVMSDFGADEDDW